MFKYTNFSEEHEEPPKPPKSRLRSSTIPKPVMTRSVERPCSGSYAVPKNKNNINTEKDVTISERYSNSSYNRLPSPKERFQALASAAKKTRPPLVNGKCTDEEQRKPPKRACERVSAPRPLPRIMPMKQSCSGIIKKGSLGIECEKSNTTTSVEMKVRPKTSGCSRKESFIEQKVLHTVKDVLSRAVMQQGKIDESNIENIISSMRSSLNLDKNIDDDDVPEIDVELKPSQTTVNEMNLSEEPSNPKKKKPSGGIVRKDTQHAKPERKPYKRIYNEIESAPSKQIINIDAPDENDETFVCVHLPDSGFFNFPSSKKKNGKTVAEPNIEVTVSQQNIQIHSSKRNEFLKQFEVGDFQTKDSNRFWSSAEDEKLRSYIDSLVRNMKTQLACESASQEVDIDSQGTVCKSFCVCKVCVSKSDSSKGEPKQKPSIFPKTSFVATETPKPLDSIVRRPVKSGQDKPQCRIQRVVNNRLRLVRPETKDVGTDSPCTFLKSTNPNFKPKESSLNTSLHLTSTNKGTSYTMVAADSDNQEDMEEMYLQRRRVKKSPTKMLVKKMKDV